MLKQWLDAGKCLIGAHQGDWAFEADGTCRMIQVCRVCAQETRKTEHLWASWPAPGEDDCTATRSCTRCRETESRVEHEWGEPAYREPFKCEQGRQCARCGAWQDDVQVVHGWSGWTYSEAHRCPVRLCARCGIGITSFGSEFAGETDAAPVTGAAGHGSATATTAANEDDPGRYALILEEYAAVLARDGLSEYAMQQAINAIKDLPADPEDDPRAAFQATMGLFDMSIRYADGETAQALAAFRQSLEQQYAALTGEAVKISAADAGPLAEQILDDLRSALAAGEPPGVEASKAIAAFQSLLTRVDDDSSEDDVKPLVAQMLRVQEILLPYGPASARQSMEETNVLVGMVTDALEIAPDDRVGQALVEHRMNEQLARAFPTLDAWSVSTELEAVPHVRHFAGVLPRLMDRMFDPALDAVTARGDRDEVKRLRDRLNARLQLVRHARTEAEIIAPQREGLRRTAIEFRQFERRRHVMVADPPFPTNAVAPDGNRLFFSGAASVETLLHDAIREIGLSLPPAHGLSNRTHGRWQQLREAAIAVFDYSDYDPAVADPRLFAEAAGSEQVVLAAAGPIATVAYETGWAYVLGKPIVTIGRRDRPLPFDIDVHPVLLDDSAGDADRLLAAIQAAFYGTPHGIPGDCLQATIDHVRGRFAASGDEETQALLGALTAEDATQVRLLLQAIAARVPGAQPLVTIPTFPGCYPAGRTVFHVTAFRDWTHAAQEETRAACVRGGFEYRIGYERIGEDILLEVWKDICGSSLIVAEVTHLNPNAALELGIAHALGRRTLILTQNRQPHVHFPPIEKVRTHHYDAVGGRAALAALLDRFLAGAD